MSFEYRLYDESACGVSGCMGRNCNLCKGTISMMQALSKICKHTAECIVELQVLAEYTASRFGHYGAHVAS